MAKVKITIKDNPDTGNVKATFDFGKNFSEKSATYAQEIGMFLNGAFNEYMKEIKRRNELAEMIDGCEKEFNAGGECTECEHYQDCLNNPKSLERLKESKK